MPRIIYLFLLAFLCSIGQAQEAVEIKENVSFWYLFMEFEGDHSAIPEKIGPFLQEVRKQNLQSQIEGDLFGIFFDAPIIVEGRGKNWGLGFKTAEGTVVRLPLKKQVFRYDKVAKTVYRGPFEGAGNAFNILLANLEEQDYEVIGPPVQVWIGNPAQDKPEDLKTEIMIPVRKRTK